MGDTLDQLKQIQSKLEKIRSERMSVNDEGLAEEKLSRWKEKTFNVIGKTISPEEAKKFKTKAECGVLIMGADPFYYFDTEVKRCEEYLSVLIEDIEEDGGPISSQTPPVENSEHSFWSDIHPKVVEVAKDKFESKHYADSVESAFKEINARVKKMLKEKTGQELDGAGLMTTAFSVENPKIALSDLSTQSGKEIQKGYMQIFAGSMTGIRNPKAHENLQISSLTAKHHLYLASLLMHRIDESR